MNTETLTLTPPLSLWQRLWRLKGVLTLKSNAGRSVILPCPTTFPPQNASDGLKTGQGMASEEPEPIYPVTNQQLSVGDGVVWEGGKRTLSTRARLQKLMEGNR